MVTCPAFFAFIVSFDNLTDYNTNFEFAMCSAWTRLFQAALRQLTSPVL